MRISTWKQDRESIKKHLSIRWVQALETKQLADYYNVGANRSEPSLEYER